MKQITHTAFGALAAVLMLTGTVAARSPVTTQLSSVAPAKPPASVPIALTAQTGSPADRVARILMAHDLGKLRRAGEEPLVLVGTAHLAGNDVLFVQVQSARDCGSAGCNTVSFKKTNGKWVKILDTVAGTIRVAESRHRGMPDLILKDTDKVIWDGTRYV